MSIMCPMNECTKRPGMCGHEKTMLIMIAMMIVGGVAYWVFA